MYESTAMFFGTVSILIYSVTAYICRRNIISFIDCITTICWISANYVWMCGEFFLRYNSLQYDDLTEHNDGSTRIASSCLFCFGISLQIIVTSYLLNNRYKFLCVKRKKTVQHKIEMFTMCPIAPSTHDTYVDDRFEKGFHHSLSTDGLTFSSHHSDTMSDESEGFRDSE